MTRLLLFLALAIQAPAADYPMFRGGPERLGRSPEKLGLPVRVLWKKVLLGAVYSSPAIVDGTAYFANSNHYVYAYDLRTGSKKWKTQLEERVYGSSPQVEGGILTIACVDGCIYTLDASSGTIQTKTCVQKLKLLGHGPDILGSPLVSKGRLFFGSDNGEIYGYRGTAKMWFYATADCVHDSAPALDGNTLFMGSTDGHVYALDADSGKEIWKSPEFEKINSTPLVFAGKVYIGAGDRQFRCLDAGSGKVLWGYETGKGIMSSPALGADSNSLVFGGADGNVYCLDLNGKLKWKFATHGPVLASPLVTGDSVWIGSYDRHFYGLKMSDGSRIFELDCEAGIFSSAAASDGRIVFGDRSGDLYCLQASSH